MEQQTVFYLYAEIRRLEAVVKRHEEARGFTYAKKARTELWAAQRELAKRIRKMVDSGEQMPEHFTEVSPAASPAGAGQAKACPTVERRQSKAGPTLEAAGWLQ
jgi:hypothetical protein